MISVFVVDDHEIVRRGVVELINAERNLEVVGEAGNVRAALLRVEATRPDVAVIDVRLPDGTGIDLCREIRSRHPETHCLILTAFDEESASIAAVVAGASGYILKDIRGRALIDGIERAARGESLLPPQIRQAIAERHTGPDEPVDRLSRRERQTFELITDGLSNRQIGDRLDITEKTVKNYVTTLLAKLDMERRTQVAAAGATARANAANAHPQHEDRHGQDYRQD